MGVTGKWGGVPYGAGHYRVAHETGAIAAGAGANSEIWQFRWTSTDSFAVVSLLQLDYLYATTGFTAGLGTVRATVARGFTAAGTGGGTATLTGDNNQMKGSMSASGVSEIRISTTAALGAGTKTFDSQDIGRASQAIPATTNANLLDTKPLVLYQADVNRGDHPLVLGQNEGLVVRATVPALGVWIAGVTATWAEVSK